MKKEVIELHKYKLRLRQRVLFRAFAINLMLVFTVWLMTFSNGFMGFVAHLLKATPEIAFEMTIDWLAFWDLAGVVFFLIPALAVWWERRMMNKNS